MLDVLRKTNCKGVVEVTRTLLDDMREEHSQLFFQDLIIVRAEYLYLEDKIIYHCYSKHFAPVDVGYKAYQWKAIFTDKFDDNGDFESTSIEWFKC